MVEICYMNSFKETRRQKNLVLPVAFKVHFLVPKCGGSKLVGETFVNSTVPSLLNPHAAMFVFKELSYE